jgi:serine/threonine protein kinase
MSTDLDHWHIDATVFKDRVEEIHFISDPARNVRRRQHKTIWEVERSLGRGGFGEVRLERNREDSKTRAVKRIAITGMTLSNSDYEKELEALLEFSKPKVYYMHPLFQGDVG